jgi:hypothetical protein
MQEERYIKIDEDGNKFYYKDKAMTVLHRSDGPAIEWADGGKEWYVDGKRHRTDGPAIEYTNGHKYWYVDGKLHRIDGPAVEYVSGTKEWYVDDKRLSEEKFKALTKPIELTLEDIAAKFGVDVNNLKIVK